MTHTRRTIFFSAITVLLCRVEENTRNDTKNIKLSRSRFQSNKTFNFSFSAVHIRGHFFTLSTSRAQLSFTCRIWLMVMDDDRIFYKITLARFQHMPGPRHANEKSSMEFGRLRILSVFLLSALCFYVLSNYTSSGICYPVRKVLRFVLCSSVVFSRIRYFMHTSTCCLCRKRLFHERILWSLPSAIDN